jgi:HTH-type transcriptional regulator/antitoxin HigA
MSNYINRLKKNVSYLEKGVNINDVVPSYAMHPGEELLDELKARSISQKDFAELSSIHPSQLNEIIKGKRGINADIALQIGTALNIPAEFWLRSQMFYELTLAKIRAKEAQEALKKSSKKLAKV